MNYAAALRGNGTPTRQLLGFGDVINTTDVRIGDIIKLKKPTIVTVDGATTGKYYPVDTVFVNGPVTKITQHAIFLKGNPKDVWLVRDPSAYIVVDSDASFLRTVSITVDNQGTTLAKPVVAAADAVKAGIDTAVDTVKNVGSGLFTAGKWILGAAIVLGGAFLIMEAKSFVKAAKE